jgi:hypothetical protein
MNEEINFDNPHRLNEAANPAILSLFDFTGEWSKPYREAGYEVIQIDIKNGIDILKWNYKQFAPGYFKIILAAVPCTDYALSGAAWFEAKDNDGRTDASQMLVAKTKEIIEYFKPEAWVIENPMSRIHKLNEWMGQPILKFNPCDFAGYSEIPEKNRYNKQTWLWGKFNIPEKKRIEPLQKEFPGHLKLGGKSERTKELRSITPDGFAKAFFQFNH